MRLAAYFNRKMLKRKMKSNFRKEIVLSLSIANFEDFKIVVECSTFFPEKGLLRRHRVYSLGLS
jgi:hypothetical protein